MTTHTLLWGNGDMEEKTIVLCKDNLVHCFCHEAKEHEGLHKCRCGGSWDENKTPHSFPTGGFGAFPLLDWEKEELAK